ncbi:uncharacterized protein LOC111288924 [Durio zibethinus]|uniref:Uncharacterized protein LOC111288924 n=1 Tax=Durio zibethinus TaxID=66656 RepID=A0A6P5Y6H9_DURZI|nr:uncharacterized protein LOC111288924 [Durio zibethinus]
MRYVLGQRDETSKKEHAIYYLSKKFTEYEAKYPQIEKICCALAWTTRKLRQYILYHITRLISKLDPLKYIFEKPSLSGRIARWQVMLLEYDIVYVTQKSIKRIADFLANRAIEDYKPMKFEFSNENLMPILQDEVEEPIRKVWKMFFDGVSNIIEHGIGVVLISPEGNYYLYTVTIDFNCTNNVTEYGVCVIGLQMAIEKKIETLKVYEDSALVIYQLKSE